ncbi:MAG TPA: hypothetical protein DCL54_14455 [Alphaproteobacteria bacterium]|nr:hypothetical protein [Alphaproteobacteria bacterium]HAJ47772.1 hypothetical protein [Alphaproteobacteria bacterium]
MEFPEWAWPFVILIAALIAWKIYGGRVLAALDAQEQKRYADDAQLIADARNPRAHFRRSLDAINEQVAPVLLIKTDTGRAITWDGQTYDSIEGAEDARWRHVIAQARSFYEGLDEEFGLRLAGPAPSTAREA